jgi:cytoskeleton protein RodZ
MTRVFFLIVVLASLFAAPSTNSAGASDPAPSRISLKAVEAAYLQVRDSNLPRGQSVLIARVLNIGDVYFVPNRSGLVMQTGNAGGIEVTVDGRNLGVLGKSGQVVTRVPLTPEFLLGYLPATQ